MSVANFRHQLVPFIPKQFKLLRRTEEIPARVSNCHDVCRKSLTHRLLYFAWMDPTTKRQIDGNTGRQSVVGARATNNVIEVLVIEWLPPPVASRTMILINIGRENITKLPSKVN